MYRHVHFNEYHNFLVVIKQNIVIMKKAENMIRFNSFKISFWYLVREIVLLLDKLYLSGMPLENVFVECPRLNFSDHMPLVHYFSSRCN